MAKRGQFPFRSESLPPTQHAVIVFFHHPWYLAHGTKHVTMPTHHPHTGVGGGKRGYLSRFDNPNHVLCREPLPGMHGQL